MAQFSQKEIERDSAVKKVEYTNWDDIVVIHFKSPVMRPDNISEFTGDFEISHIDFDRRQIEYTEK